MSGPEGSSDPLLPLDDGLSGAGFDTTVLGAPNAVLGGETSTPILKSPFTETTSYRTAVSNRFPNQSSVIQLGDHQIADLLEKRPTRFHGLLKPEDGELRKNSVEITSDIGTTAVYQTVFHGFPGRMGITLLNGNTPESLATALASGYTLFHTAGNFKVVGRAVQNALLFGKPQHKATSASLPFASQLFLMPPNGRATIREILYGARSFHMTKTWKVLCGQGREEAEEMAEGTSVLILKDKRGLISYNTRFSGRYRFGSYGRPNPKNTLSSEEAVHGAMKELATGRDLFWRCDEMSGDNVVRVFSIHEWLGIVERSGKSPDTALKNAGYPPLASLKTIKERTVAGELEVIGVIDIVYSEADYKAEIARKVQRMWNADADPRGGVTT